MAKASAFDKRKIECTNENRPWSPEELRHYKELESTYAHINLLDSVKTVPLTCVRSCLHEIAKDHYMLHAKTVVQSNGDVCFAKMADINENDDWIPLELHSTKTRFEWKNILKESFQKGFDFENDPLWKVLWVTCPSEGDSSFSYIFILIACHAIIDAKSATDLCGNQFLGRLNSVIKGEILQPEKRPIYFTEPVEVVFGGAEPGVGLCKYPKPWYVKLIVNSIFFFKRNEINSDVPTVRCVEEPTNDATGSYFPFEIDVATSEKFFKFCKQKSVTVHSVLLAILGNSLKFMEKDYDKLKGSFEKLFYSIDLRKFDDELNKSPMPLGCFVNADKVDIKGFDISDSNAFCSHAEKLNKAVTKAKKAPVLTILYSLIAYVAESNRFNKFFKAAGVTAFLSNLGRVNQVAASNDHDAVKLVGQYFTANVRSPFIFMTTLSFKGKMFFCVAYDGKWITEEFIELLSEHLKMSIDMVGKMEE